VTTVAEDLSTSRIAPRRADHRARDDRITAVNVVELEQYLLRVVPREMDGSPPPEIEALKPARRSRRTPAPGNLGGGELARLLRHDHGPGPRRGYGRGQHRRAGQDAR
jgi:hypothetical protein